MAFRLSSVVKRHPIIVFFVLAFALSWWPIPFYAALFPDNCSQPSSLSPLPMAGRDRGSLAPG